MKKLFTPVLFTVMCAFFVQQAQAQIVFNVNSPGNIAGNLGPVGSPNEAFGGELVPGESISGDLAIGLTADPDPVIAAQACTSLVNPGDVAGKIALVNRGGCFFSDKVWYAQEAGAVGVIICNYVDLGDEVIDMGADGDYAGLDTIPSCMLSYNDCQVLVTEILAGNTVNVTFYVPGFLDEAMAYSYHTPVSQIFPLEDIRIRLINTTGADANNITFNCDVTNPDGDVETLEVVVDFLAAADDTLVTFPAYTPTVVGTYTGVFSNSLNSDIRTETFVITDDLFATDRNDGLFGASNQTSFETGGYQYHYGSLYQTGETPSVATHISFGLSNAADIFTGNPDFDVFTLVLYDGDANNDNTLDFNTSSPSFDDLTPLGLGNYYMTGNEGATEVLTVELLSVLGNPTIDLDTAGAYYAVVKYDGDATSAPLTPALLSSSGVNYFAFTTCLYLGGTQFFNGGWSGATTVSRLHIDETINSTDNVTRLDDFRIKVFPNPADEFVNLDLDLANMADQVRVDVINYDGKVVGNFVYSNVQKGTYSIHTANLPAGIYFLSVKTPEGYRSMPFKVAH